MDYLLPIADCQLRFPLVCGGGAWGAVGKKCNVVSEKYKYETRFIVKSYGVLVGSGRDS